MGRIRTIAAILAIVSAASAVLLARLGLGAGAVLLVAGAALLALVAPFPAPAPPRRKRVALACFGYAGILVIAALWIAASAPDKSYAMVVAAQAIAGALLGLQAYRTRNRRRQTGLRAYFVD